MGEHEPPVVNFRGERVALGPLSQALVPHLHRWTNDFHIMRTYGDPPRPVTLEERQARYERMATATDARWFAIYELGTWRPVGVADLFEIDERHRSAAFGMMIGEPDCRGKGYGTETTHLMLDYAFTALGLHSVHLDVDEFNLAGRHAYAKAGFREAGRRREATWLNGEWWDLIGMDCLASEFASPVLAKIFAPDDPRERSETERSETERSGMDAPRVVPSPQVAAPVSAPGGAS